MHVGFSVFCADAGSPVSIPRDERADPQRSVDEGLTSTVGTELGGVTVDGCSLDVRYGGDVDHEVGTRVVPLPIPPEVPRAMRRTEMRPFAMHARPEATGGHQSPRGTVIGVPRILEGTQHEAWPQLPQDGHHGAKLHIVVGRQPAVGQSEIRARSAQHLGRRCRFDRPHLGRAVRCQLSPGQIDQVPLDGRWP